MKRADSPRYVLVARACDQKRLATLTIQRHLWQLMPALRSLFHQYSAAISIDVLAWPWSDGQTIDQQEPIASAGRCDDPQFTDAVIWKRDRDLKEMEREWQEARSVEQ